ncbi:MAG: hypothetical protein PHT51_01885 [Patescibacteria group bacterium]|nr:hypothetical protein [Patescibacteria group bacterium]MDD4610352.1 hypothetical protein [Patescibacteria group bacterium]
MNFAHWLVILSVFVSASGSYAYIRDTLSGKTKPNRVSWLMWSLAPLIGTLAALSIKADFWATSRIFLAGFFPLLVFIFSFVNPKSYWKLTIFDVICGICSVVALIAWWLINSPQIAILMSAIGDGFAALPTIRKAWKFPESETGITYAAALISVILVLPSIPVWDIKNSAFQIYLLLANSILLFAVYRKKIFSL